MGSQFRNLNTNDPASWPAIPRLTLCLSVAAGIVVALWLMVINTYSDELTVEVSRETTLKAARHFLEYGELDSSLQWWNP